ncbi:hypothetical protein Syun_024054 [Stephania yunnanensis]|uniref:Uncharacterized protein n=1 Tax=Stephania yunnanensis TaxID=152371 RepID=A0AAP0I071_9MAGN
MPRGGSSSVSVAGRERKDVEKNRRIRMKNLFLHLESLIIPPNHSKRCEAAVDAAAVRAVEGDDDGDGFGSGGEKGSEEDEGRRSAMGRRRVLERREETAGVKGETAAAREWRRERRDGGGERVEPGGVTGVRSGGSEREVSGGSVRRRGTGREYEIVNACRLLSQKRNRDGINFVSKNVIANSIRNGNAIPFLI